MIRRIEKLLLVGEGERGTVAYFLLFFLLVSAGMAVGRSTADALFLKRIGIEYLPYMYMLQGVMLSAVSMVYAAFADRIPAEKFFRILFLTLFVAVLCCWLLISATASEAVYPVYYLVYEVASEVLLVHSALYMYQNMNTLQAKRLSPLFYAGAQAGTILGNLLLVYGAPQLGTQNLLLVWCLLLLAGIAVIILRHRQHGPSLYFRAPRSQRGAVQESIDQIRQGVRYTYRSSLLRAASFALFFMVIAFYVLCYSVNRIYTQTFESEVQLTQFFGLLNACTSGLALLAQLFITNRVIRRFGIRSMNLLFPVTSIASLAALMFSFNLPAALLGSFNKDALMPAFRTPVRNMFFNVLPDYIQGRSRALAVGLVLPLALVICGGMLIVMQRMENPAYFLVPGGVAALLYMYSCLKMNRAYVSTLLTTLKERLFLPSERMYKDLAGCSEEVYGEILRGVNSPDQEVSLAFSRVLVSSFPQQAADIILTRAAHSDNPTADRYLALLKPLDLSGQRAELQDLARQGDDHLRASLLRLLPGIDDRTAAGGRLCGIGDTNPRLCATAIHAALLDPAAAGRDGVLAAWHALLEQDRGAQLAALDLIPDLSGLEERERLPLESDYGRVFGRLMQDEDTTVRLRALHGMRAWQGKLPGLDDRQLAETLASDDADLREAAAGCLHLASAAGREELALLALGDANKRVRKAATEALRSCSRDYNNLALFWIAEDRGSLRGQQELLESLLHTSLPRTVFEGIARSKSQSARELQAALLVLDRHAGQHTGTAYSILRYTLQEQLVQTIELALLAMEPLYETGQIRIIRAGFTSGDKRHTANACEALENLPDQETVAGLAEILQQTTGNAVGGGTAIFNRLDEVLTWCAGHANDWLRQCGDRAMQAIHTDGSHA